MDNREKHMEEAFDSLVKAIRDVGLRPVRACGYVIGGVNGREYEVIKRGNWNSTITVLTSNEDRICATLKMNTGTGWCNRFEGWKLKLPTYQPRGEWNQREHSRDPADPAHWGFANIKGNGNVVAKIVAAQASLPTDNEIEIGKLRAKMDELTYGDRRATSDLREAFSHSDVQREIYELLVSINESGHEPLSNKLLKSMAQYGDAVERRERLAAKRKDLWGAIEALESEEARHDL